MLSLGNTAIDGEGWHNSVIALLRPVGVITATIAKGVVGELCLSDPDFSNRKRHDRGPPWRDRKRYSGCLDSFIPALVTLSWAIVQATGLAVF